MHPPAIHEEILGLGRNGLTDTEVARATGVPRSTVRYMRMAAGRPGVPGRGRAICPRCWRPARRMCFAAGDYAELLGLYLGDGCISRMGRVERLRVCLDAKYPGVVEQTYDLLNACFVDCRIGTVAADGGATAVLSVYSGHLSCLFPQHGPGKKHHRPIFLEDWQEQLVMDAPWSFIRGLIRSDGCVYINRTGRYRYLSYTFCNVSPDIKELFRSACDVVGVRHRASGKNVYVTRRPSVALMAAFVGTKR